MGVCGRPSSQLQTYQAQVPALCVSNAVLLASDGVKARIGSLGSGVNAAM
jgi:type I restriction enzyme R subunit